AAAANVPADLWAGVRLCKRPVVRGTPAGHDVGDAVIVDVADRYGRRALNGGGRRGVGIHRARAEHRGVRSDRAVVAAREAPPAGRVRRPRPGRGRPRDKVKGWLAVLQAIVVRV